MRAKGEVAYTEQRHAGTQGAKGNNSVHRRRGAKKVVQRAAKVARDGGFDWSGGMRGARIRENSAKQDSRVVRNILTLAEVREGLMLTQKGLLGALENASERFK